MTSKGTLPVPFRPRLRGHFDGRVCEWWGVGILRFWECDVLTGHALRVMELMSILQEDFWLPRSGPMPRPKSIAEAVEVLRREAFPAPGVSQVRFHAREFTSICPRSGQPDFGEVIIEYAPDKLCLESKSLKFYLWAFREEAGYAEGLAARIADDLYEVLQPRWVRVIVRQYPRGGIEIEAEAVRPNP